MLPPTPLCVVYRNVYSINRHLSRHTPIKSRHMQHIIARRDIHLLFCNTSPIYIHLSRHIRHIATRLYTISYRDYTQRIVTYCNISPPIATYTHSTPTYCNIYATANALSRHTANLRPLITMHTPYFPIYLNTQPIRNNRSRHITHTQ